MDQIKPLANSGPGMGTGNIPFAPGAQSGNFGGPPAPPARMVGGAHQSMRPGPGNPGHPAGPAGNLGGAGGPDQGPPMPPPMPAPPGAMGGFDPTALFQMVKAYADALQGYINNNPGGGFPW